jgi:hypothetical protein
MNPILAIPGSQSDRIPAGVEWKKASAPSFWSLAQPDN